MAQLSYVLSILEPLPYDAQKSSAEVADPLLLSPNSKKAYESNKRLPMKLRGKGTRKLSSVWSEGLISES